MPRLSRCPRRASRAVFTVAVTLATAIAVGCGGDPPHPPAAKAGESGAASRASASASGRATDRAGLPAGPGHNADAASSSTWAVDPREPGPDLPPAGRSLFDFLVTERRRGEAVVDIPFPFTALLERIEARQQAHPYFSSPVGRVLIPLGRSLQRNTAAPDFFAHPRAVAAALAEPRADDAGGGMLLKNRLFLGYQEQSGLIEVISYNEAAGRFEFQLVKDYREGAEPKLVYARRTLCIACHQNAAPIFARPLWDETNASSAITARLAAEKRSFYGFPLSQGVDVAYALDNATDEANLVMPAQRVWRDACANGDPMRAAACRGELLRAALLWRLGGARFPPAFGERVEHTRLAAAWQRLWPGGLAVPTADIPNRDPLAANAAADETSPVGIGIGFPVPLAGLLAFSPVPAELEPLSPRAPAELWSIADDPDGAFIRVVAALARLFAAADIALIDDSLRSRGASAMREYLAECRLWRRRTESRTLKFECGEDRGGIGVRGRLSVTGNRARTGKLSAQIRKLRLDGDTIANLDAVDMELERPSDARVVSIDLRQSRTGLRVRTRAGDAVTRIEIRWTETAGAESFPGRAAVYVAQEGQLLERTIAALARATAGGDAESLTDRPLSRAVAMRELAAHLDIADRAWCCADTAGMPAPMVDREPAREGAADRSAFPLFHRYCAACHRSDAAFPPNFLAGDVKQVKARLAHCAERIYVRLSLWHGSRPDPPKIAMPPQSALGAHGLTAETWLRHPHLAELRAAAERMLAEEGRTTPDASALKLEDYEELRVCVP